MICDAPGERNERDERPVAFPFRPDPRTIWAYEVRPDRMRVRDQDGKEVELPRALFEKIYTRC
jgi:hypothetical protein